jgi:hypothetical protein
LVFVCARLLLFLAAHEAPPPTADTAAAKAAAPSITVLEIDPETLQVLIYFAFFPSLSSFAFLCQSYLPLMLLLPCVVLRCSVFFAPAAMKRTTTTITIIISITRTRTTTIAVIITNTSAVLTPLFCRPPS